MGLATVATDANKKMVESHRKRQDEALVNRRKDMKALGEKIKNYSVTLEANATDEGQLYGSIVAADVSKSLITAGYDVPPENVDMEGPIKSLGMYTIPLKLDLGVKTEVKVWVVPTASIK